MAEFQNCAAPPGSPGWATQVRLPMMTAILGSVWARKGADEREGIAAKAGGDQAGKKAGKKAGKATGKIAGKIAGKLDKTTFTFDFSGRNYCKR